MLGAIGKCDILAHPWVTIRSFGWKVFFRALLAGHRQTFLSLLTEAHAIEVPPAGASELIERCVAVELRAHGMYRSLAARFAAPEAVSAFFRTLARQERGHAELLKLCCAATGQECWDEESLDSWRQSVSRLEHDADEAERRLHCLKDVGDGLRLVIQFESSEINQVFNGVIGASDSTFVKRQAAFRIAGRHHITFICREISRLAPELTSSCRQLDASYFGREVCADS